MRRTILNFLLRHLYKASTLEDVMTYKKVNDNLTIIYLNGEQISEQEVKNLREEAKLMKKLRIWKIIDETLEDHARQMMFKNSKNWEDMVFGKAILYNKSIERNIVDLLM